MIFFCDKLNYSKEGRGKLYYNKTDRTRVSKRFEKRDGKEGELPFYTSVLLAKERVKVYFSQPLCPTQIGLGIQIIIVPIEKQSIFPNSFFFFFLMKVMKSKE